jgi:membrane fusion protein (multidrug efflux system)
MQLGRRVKRGDVLIELDANVQELEAREQEAQGSAYGEELAALDRAIAAESQSLRDEEKVAEASILEARARLREAEASASYLTLDMERKSQLRSSGLISELDFARAKSDSAKQQAVVDALRASIVRQEKQKSAQRSERQARIESLRREMAQLAGQSRKSGAALDRLRSEVELRRIVASVDGVLGEVAPLRVGAVITAGEKLAAIVPDGKLRVIAQFKPSAALGRIRAGQNAKLRLDGFPWTQYGTLTARVSEVANEVREGYVRVELTPAAHARMPLQHGLPGITEVEVERIAPAALLMRVAGQQVTVRPNEAEEKREKAEQEPAR